MSIESYEANSPPSLQEALGAIAAWERGELNDLSPDGLAVVLYLREARLGQLSTVTVVEIDN